MNTWIQLARFDKPIGIYLLLWPCFWGLLAGGIPTPYTALLFIAGAAVMRAAGCVYNDTLDADIDRQVARTRTRPLASGTLSRKQAMFLLGFLLTAGLVILLQLPPITQLWGVASLVLVALYPLMKRMTHWPQAFLGFTFNWGVWMGWSVTAHDQTSWEVPAALYSAGFFWTLFYDTIYAYQDLEDDMKVGVKSSAIQTRHNPKTFLLVMACLMAICLVVAGALMKRQDIYYMAPLTILFHQLWCIATLDIHSSPNCLKRFRACHWQGVLLILFLALSAFIK